jgi:membrane protease YdiL (CAAX protease family)
MTPESEPEALHSQPHSGFEEFSVSPGSESQSDHRFEVASPAPIQTPDFYVSPPHLEPELDSSRWPRLIPHLGHTVLFFVIALLVLAVGQGLGILLLEQTHLFGHRNFQALFRLSADDARLSLPVQGLSYTLVAVVIIPIFSLIWREPFSEGVHWNASVARRRFLLLALLGLAAGFGIGTFGNFLPMPKDPPIMQDMMKSALGAWMMLIFGITAAPLLEELAFRGFLLPGLINSFRWLARIGSISESAVKWIGIPISIFITSAGFALMHSPQVSHAWGPLLLIGMVSVVLCITRLFLNSVAAGVVVHAAYNFTLFAGMLAQTGGFRHLDRMTN